MNCHPMNPCAGVYGTSLDVKIINECNASCAFCIEKGGHSPARAGIQELVDAANKLQCDNILILGGEPMLDFQRLVDFIRGIDYGPVNVVMTTNGTLLDRVKAKTLAKAGLGAINISMHFYRADELSALTGFKWDQFNIDLVKGAIDEFRKHGVPARLNCNIIRGGIDSPQEALRMMSFAAEMGFDSIRFAELQGAHDEFVDASDVFKGIASDNPFTKGCEIHMPEGCGLPVVVRRTCGIVNPAKAKVTSPRGRKAKTAVLYPDARVGSWKDEGCHGSGNSGCHGRSS